MATPAGQLSVAEGIRLPKCTDPGPRQLTDISTHALALADVLTPDPYDRPSLTSANSRVANLLLTLASIESVTPAVIIPWHDPGMCGIPQEQDRADAIAAVLTGSVRLQYAWAALEQLLAELPRVAGQAEMRTEEQVVHRMNDNPTLEHANCAARRLVRATPSLFDRQHLPLPNLADMSDLDSYSSGAALRCARLVRNKITHGSIAEVATTEFGGDSHLQAAVCEDATRVALFAIQFLALASIAEPWHEIPVAGTYVLRDKRASQDGRACLSVELHEDVRWGDETYLDRLMISAGGYVRVAHLWPAGSVA